MDWTLIATSSLGSGVFSGLFTGFITWKTNNRKISADIKSKSRIKWIQDVRNITIEYIHCIDNILNSGVTFNIVQGFEEPDYHDDYYKNRTKLKEIACKLKLYFPDLESENDKKSEMAKRYYEISEVINDINAPVDNHYYRKRYKALHDYNCELLNDLFCKKSNKYKNYKIKEYMSINWLTIVNMSAAEEYISEVYRYMENFQNIISIYLKIEWDKAKTGK